MKSNWTWLPLLVLWLACHAASASAEARTYTLQHRPANDIATQLRQLYPDDQLAISASNQHLILRGNTNVLDEATDLIATMDVAIAQLQITIRNSGDASAQQQGGGVSVQNNSVSVHGENRIISTRRNQEHTVVVQDGQSAQINAGEVRPLPVAFQGGRNPAAILKYVDNRSGFVVSPQLISAHQVELSIMAFDHTPDAKMSGYETEAVMTIRRVKPGQWVDLGGTSHKQESSQTGIIHQTSTANQHSQSFEIRVDVM